jgi:hypothetical protein
MSKVGLFDWVNSISNTKNLVMDDNNKKEYVPFIINKALSNFVDTIMYANEMNLYNHIPKDIQYKYLLNGIRKNKRYGKWFKPKKDFQDEIVMRYYKCNNQRASEMRMLLTDTQINELESRMDLGGLK